MLKGDFSKIPREKAALHGMICSDGTLYCGRYHRSPSKWTYALQLAEPNQTVRELFASVILKLYDIKCRDKPDRGIVTAYGKAMALDLKQLGPFGRHSWRVPFGRLDHEAAAFWLRSYFDGDGDVHLGARLGRCMVRARSVNRTGLEDVKRLLLTEFGIHCGLYPHGRPKEIAWVQSFDLVIYRMQDLLSYAATIGFNHPRKSEKLNRMVSLRFQCE